ncbi:MAG: AarF/UbiB family protein, partial [Anaerolineae bacterium]
MTNGELWSIGDGKSRAARTVEILLTLSRFGFGELIERSWWARWLPGVPMDQPGDDSHEAGAVRLRKLFEALGPSFVKIGQLLALHAGALPLAYREELSQLLDSTLPLPFAVMEAVLADELGEDWRRFFQEIDVEPLASASIGQVHRGVLESGEEVAVKVQRPGAQRIFERDFDIVGEIVRYTRMHTLLR